MASFEERQCHFARLSELLRLVPKTPEKFVNLWGDPLPETNAKYAQLLNCDAVFSESPGILLGKRDFARNLLGIEERILRGQLTSDFTADEQQIMVETFRTMLKLTLEPVRATPVEYVFEKLELPDRTLRCPFSAAGVAVEDDMDKITIEFRSPSGNTVMVAQLPRASTVADARSMLDEVVPQWRTHVQRWRKRVLKRHVRIVAGSKLLEPEQKLASCDLQDGRVVMELVLEAPGILISRAFLHLLDEIILPLTRAGTSSARLALLYKLSGDCHWCIARAADDKVEATRARESYCIALYWANSLGSASSQGLTAFHPLTLMCGLCLSVVNYIQIGDYGVAYGVTRETIDEAAYEGFFEDAVAESDKPEDKDAIILMKQLQDNSIFIKSRV